MLMMKEKRAGEDVKYVEKFLELGFLGGSLQPFSALFVTGSLSETHAHVAG